MASSSSSSSWLLSERVGGSVPAEEARLGLGPAGRGLEEARPVRRSLFGPVDHQQLQEDFQKLLNVGVAEATQRWSYDFQRDRPAAGAALEWEELRCQDVPTFYRSCLVKRGGAERTRRAGVAERWSQPQSPASSCGSAEEYLEVTTRGSYRIQSTEKMSGSLKGVKRRQACITDFFSVKKRKFLHHKRQWQ